MVDRLLDRVFRINTSGEDELAAELEWLQAHHPTIGECEAHPEVFEAWKARCDAYEAEVLSPRRNRHRHWFGRLFGVSLTVRLEWGRR